MTEVKMEVLLVVRVGGLVVLQVMVEVGKVVGMEVVMMVVEGAIRVEVLIVDLC